MRVEPSPVGSAKYAVPADPPAARRRRSSILPWALVAVMAVVMLALLLPRFAAMSPASSQPEALAPTDKATAPQNLTATLTDGRLTVSWSGTNGEYLVRAADADDELPDDEVFEIVRTTSRSAVLSRILPGHTYTICVYPAGASPDDPAAASTTFRAADAVSLNKYSLTLAAFSVRAYPMGNGHSTGAIDVDERLASDAAQWLRTGERGFTVELLLAHQQMNNDRSVHYTLALKAPGGATCALSADGTLRLATGQQTSCTFDLTDAMTTLMDHGCLTPGWYTVSLNIDGKHAVKHSFHLN